MSKKTKNVQPEKKRSPNFSPETPVFSNSFFYILIFTEGFLIMGVELLGSGLITPHFGSSLSVWTFVLGITMAALACAYFFGAYLATKTNVATQLSRLLLLASFSIFFMPDMRSLLFRAKLDLELIPMLFVCVTPLLFLPLFFLGSLSPLLIRQLSERSGQTGFSSGKTYALSTLGGVFAALITAFVLLEFTSVNNAIYWLAMLCATALFLTLHHNQQSGKKWLTLGVMLFGSMIFFKSTNKRFAEILPRGYNETYYDDGILGQLRVLDNYRNKSRSLFVNNTVQSISTLDGLPIWEYVSKITAIVNQSKNSRILLAGLGGGILNQQISAQQGAIDIVDMDARMLDICENYFHYKLASKDQFYTDDIRHFIRNTTQKYDYIILDLSAAENVPVNVYTKEGFAEIKKILNPNGTLLIHYFCNMEIDGKLTLSALGNTLNAAGLPAQLLKTEIKKDELSSMVFVAGNSKKALFDEKMTPVLPFSFRNGEILTDDKPKLDMLRRNMAKQTRSVYIKNYHKIWETIRKYGIEN